MKKLFTILSLFIVATHGYGQNASIPDSQYQLPAEYVPLLNLFKANRYINQFKSDSIDSGSIQPPLIYQDEQYQVRLSKATLGLSKQEKQFINPYSTEPYPLAYSVLFQGYLVTLFDPGYFACYKTTTWERDQAFEQKLNTSRFKYHWIIDNQLVGLSKSGYYVFNNDTWKRYKKPVPFKKQPKLFEDEYFLSFASCYGEFGGTVFFFDKRTQHTYFTEATCANSILKQDSQYYLLCNLGHMMGSVKLKEIADPTRLTRLRKKHTFHQRRMDLGYADSSHHARSVFDYFGIQIFSSFRLAGKSVYMVHWREATFLAYIDDNKIEVIDPLFTKELYTHNPVTTTYGDGLVLMNLDFYGLGGDKEVSCLMLKDEQIIKINWQEKH